MIKQAAVITGLALLAACAAVGDAVSNSMTLLDEATFVPLAEAPPELVGEYSLVEMADVPVPGSPPGHRVSCPDGGTLVAATVQSGTLMVSQDGSIMIDSEIRGICRADEVERSETWIHNAPAFFRSFDREAGELRIRARELGTSYPEFAVDLRSGTITWTQGGARWKKRSAGAPAPAVIASSDTAGLNRRIADAFPGYRLSTETEIGARFPLVDGTTLKMYVPDYGTGDVWWVKRADLTGDGEDDILTIATSVADPREDQLVVLHADGAASRVGSLGGWGFAHGEDDQGAYIAMVYWEKGADIFRWDGNAFRPYHDPDACC